MRRDAAQRRRRAELKRDCAAWIRESMNRSLNGAELDLDAGLALLARLEGTGRPMPIPPVRFQLLRRRAGEERWSFVAHGAAYDRDELEREREAAARNGAELRAIPL